MQPRQTFVRQVCHVTAIGFALLAVTSSTAFAATLARAPGASAEAAMRASVGRARLDAVNLAIHGEAKNVWPFTRRVAGRSPQAAPRASAPASAPRGEPKNEPPFVRPALAASSSGDVFDWTDGAIGLLAGIGITLFAAGVLLIARRSTVTA